TSAGKGCWVRDVGYVIDSSSLRAVPLFVPGLTSRCSFVRAWRSFLRPGLRAPTRRAQGPSRPAIVLSWRLALPLPGCALTAPSTARGSGRSGRRLLRLDAFEGASIVENSPRDPGELVGERN